jgi:hypothetical protein
MTGGSGIGIGGVRLADGNNDGAQCGCFATVSRIQNSGSIAGLNNTNVSTLVTGEEWVIWVESVRAPWRLDRSVQAATLTVNHKDVEAVLGEPNSRWLRLQWQDVFWKSQLTWFIDPANSTALASDENDGLTAITPLLSTAEYRRRVFGANYTASPTINFLSASTVTDDGNFTGIKGTAIIFNIIGTPVKIGATGTIDAAVVPFAGNGRYTITDTSENWTTNGWVSTATNPRLVRNTAKTKHAWVKSYLGGGVASISQPTDASETAGFSNSNVDFVNGETYEVCSIPTLPTLQMDVNSGLTIVVRCMKITTGPLAPSGTLFGVLAGIVPASAMAWTESGTTPAFFNCFFGGVQSFFAIPIFRTCLALGASLQFYKSIDNTTNSLDLQNSGVAANGVAGSIGLLRAFDCTGAVFTARYGASPLVEGLVGTGNTGKLLVATKSVIYGGGTATAATTDANPFQLNAAVGAVTPVVDAVAGGAIYT